MYRSATRRWRCSVHVTPVSAARERVGSPAAPVTSLGPALATVIV